MLLDASVVLMELLSDAAAATAAATAAAKAAAPANAPVARPPTACPPVAMPGAGPSAPSMAATCGGGGGLFTGGVGGPPGDTEVENPEFTVVVVPAALTVAAPSITVTLVNPLAATVTTRMVPLIPIDAVGVRMEYTILWQVARNEPHYAPAHGHGNLGFAGVAVEDEPVQGHG